MLLKKISKVQGARYKAQAKVQDTRHKPRYKAQDTRCKSAPVRSAFFIRVIRVTSRSEGLSVKLKANKPIGIPMIFLFENFNYQFVNRKRDRIF